MGGPIDMEPKGCESIGCYYPIMWPWAMTLTLDFEGQILKKKLFHRNKDMNP